MCLSQSYDKCFLGSSETADANRVFCGQLGAIYVFSEALNPAQIFAIHQLGPGYKVCIRFAKVRYIPMLHSHHWSPRDVIPLSVAFGHWLMCVQTWFHHPEETTAVLGSKSQLISSWSLLSSYHVTKTPKLEKTDVRNAAFTYLPPNVCLTNLILFVVMHYCFYTDDSNVSRFCFLMKSSVDEVCLRIVFSLSFPFMSLTFCR